MIFSFDEAVKIAQDQFTKAANPMWRATGYLSLCLMGKVDREKLIEDCTQISETGDIYESPIALAALSLVGNRPADAFERAKRRADFSYPAIRTHITSGWNMLASLAETAEEAHAAYKVIMANEDNQYRDMGPYVLPCAAIANPEAKDEIYLKIKKKIEVCEVAQSYDRAFYALALVGLALTCPVQETEEVFQKCVKQRWSRSYLEYKFAFLGMSLVARNNDQLKAELMSQVGEVLTEGSWNGNVVLAAMLAVAISASNDYSQAKRALATFLYGPVFW